MDQYRSRLKLSENFERHWSTRISGEIHMDQSLVHTFFLGKFVWTNGPESSSKVPPYTGLHWYWSMDGSSQLPHFMVHVFACVGDPKSLSIAKNHLKPSQEFSEQFGPSIHKMKGFCRNSLQKVHANFAQKLGRQILGNTFSGRNCVYSKRIISAVVLFIPRGSAGRLTPLASTDGFSSRSCATASSKRCAFC